MHSLEGLKWNSSGRVRLGEVLPSLEASCGVVGGEIICTRDSTHLLIVLVTISVAQAPCARRLSPVRRSEHSLYVTTRYHWQYHHFHSNCILATKTV